MCICKIEIWSDFPGSLFIAFACLHRYILLDPLIRVGKMSGQVTWNLCGLGYISLTYTGLWIRNMWNVCLYICNLDLLPYWSLMEHNCASEHGSSGSKTSCKTSGINIFRSSHIFIWENACEIAVQEAGYSIKPNLNMFAGKWRVTAQEPVSTSRHRLIDIRNPVIKIRRSHDPLIFTMGILYPKRLPLYWNGPLLCVGTTQEYKRLKHMCWLMRTVH